MIVGFLGKGGSGKTSLASLFIKYLIDENNFEKEGNVVLALDNDHNMDLKFNLLQDNNLEHQDMNYIGQSLEEIFQAIQFSTTKDVAKVDDEEYFFSLNEVDDITKKYSKKLSDNLYLMCSWPHTEDMMYGNMCSHGLTTPLKIYLPLLKLNDREFVIVDEKAGTDGVGTGVTTGFNLAVVVAEATTHGIKSAKQIINMLKFFNTPYVVAINKIRDGQNIDDLKKEFADSKAIDILEFNLDFGVLDLKINDQYKKEFKKIFDICNDLNDDRKARTKERIKKQEEFNKGKV